MSVTPSSLLLRLNPKVLAAFVFLSVFGGSLVALGYLYYEASEYLEASIRAHVTQLARTAATLVDVEQHEQLVEKEQTGSDLYRSAQESLVQFHLNSSSIHYVYTLRVSADGREHFILDTSTDPRVVRMLELHGRDVVPSYLMEEYEVPERDDTDTAKAAKEQGLVFVYELPYEDVFGAFITAAAPLFTAEGEYVGYAGVDYDLDAYLGPTRDLRHCGLMSLAMAFVLGGVLARLAYRMRKELSETVDQISEAERQARLAKERAEAAVQAKAELMAVVAHDLRTPLSTISMLAGSLVMDPLPDATPGEVEDLRIIAEAASQMHELISRILASEELDQGGLHYSGGPVDVSLLAEKVARFNQSSAGPKGIRIDARIEPNCRARIDVVRVREAFDNLLSNAIKYSPKGSRVCVGLESVRAGACIRFFVQDEGPGLSEGDQAKLFQKFQKLSALPTGGEHSTGLGLSIVKTVSELHGGVVGCDSELGQGALFWMELPVGMNGGGIEH